MMERILIVDDSPLEIKIICRLFDEKYEIVETTSGKGAVELAVKTRPDLILLDIIMPDMDGLEVCRLLKQRPETVDIPVLFITSAAEYKDVVKGFEAGGQDYITKPVYPQELSARVKVHLELKRSRNSVLAYAKELESKNAELQNLLVRLEAAAMTDYLTGLFNRRYIYQRLKEIVAENKRYSWQAAIIMADIDNFKRINDLYGHDCGDAVLQELSVVMKAIVREEDSVSRWGGEEFLLLLPHTDLDKGLLVAEKIRKAVATHVFVHKQEEYTVTVTLGVATLDYQLGIDGSIDHADKALYHGKRMNKNVVVSFQDL